MKKIKKILAFSLLFALSVTINAQNQLPTTPYESTSYSTIKYQDNSYVKLFKNTSDPSYSKGEIYNSLGDLISQKIINVNAANAISIYSLNGILEQHHEAVNVEQVNGYPGDCSKLGGLKKGETWDDCWNRNMTNFCCDLIGCLTMATSPVLVSIAAGISCLTLDAPLIVLINVAGTVVYERQQ